MYKRIVVGTDGSPSAFQAVKAAAELARQSGAELHLVTAFRPMASLMNNPEFAMLAATALDGVDPTAGAREVTNRTAEALKGIEVQQHQVGAPAADALCDLAANIDADLIVVGNKGMTGARRILGSVPNSVAHNATCSVLIVNTN
ncbi:MAG: universal stress protein [Acidimicrobiales bacterium]|nr:universal stress protein [Acidimicrobiales bacterium]